MERGRKKKKLKLQDPVPYKLTIYKGAKSWKLPRSFVSFLLNHPVAKEFLKWSEATWISDEMVVPTLSRVSQVTEIDSHWEVVQNKTPSPNDHFQLWRVGCRGVLR